MSKGGAMPGLHPVPGRDGLDPRRWCRAGQWHTSSLLNWVDFVSIFRHRQQLRRWAAGLLVLWLVGLGQGIANACLLVPGMVMSAPAMAAQAQAQVHGDEHGISGPAADEPGARVAPGSQDEPDGVDCCDEASPSTPLLKSALDGLQGHAAVPPAMPTVLPMPAFAPMQMWMPRRDGVPAPTIPIAFLRLAL